MTTLLPMPFPNPRTYPGHSGVDFPQPRGTAIRASGPGRVLRLSHTAAGGYWTVVRYDNGAVIGYAHQDRPVTVVDIGDHVDEGTIIGFVGSLGLRSTGPHLHAANIEQQTYAATMALFDTTRVVGAPAPASITPDQEEEMNAAQEAKLDALVADVEWLKDRIGGGADTTSLTDRLRALAPVVATVEWIKERIGGSTKTAPSVATELRDARDDGNAR